MSCSLFLGVTGRVNKLEIRGLLKIYGKIPRIKRSGHECGHRGALYGFVGPNGAGKTTTIKIMTGLLPAEEGKITIDGMDALSNLKALKARIGYVPDFFGVYDNLTVSEYMEFFASCHHMDGAGGKEALHRPFGAGGPGR